VGSVFSPRTYQQCLHVGVPVGLSQLQCRPPLPLFPGPPQRLSNYCTQRTTCVTRQSKRSFPVLHPHLRIPNADTGGVPFDQALDQVVPARSRGEEEWSHPLHVRYLHARARLDQA
jgi:hypothetical protein